MKNSFCIIDKLYHMHMHDAVGSRCHLTLGTGEIDIKKYFDLARVQDARIMLETKTVDGLTQSVSYVNTRLL